jgi:hypothetical protein
VTAELSPESIPEPASTGTSAVKVEHSFSPPALPVSDISQYHDRSGGLLVFGVIQVVLGLLAALMVPFVALGAFLTRFTPGASMRPAQYISGMATYGMIAAVLLTLGIGSVQTKRWARALTLVISWYWLITGVLITVLMTAVLPVTMRTVLHAQQNAVGQPPGLSAPVMAVILTVIIALAALVLIVVPIAFVVFYGRNDVAETCYHRDPIERWTDRVPLPVLGASVVLVAQALYLFSAGLTTPMFPFFGRYLLGAPALAWFLAFAALDACLAVAFLRVRAAAWWIAIVAAPVRLLSMAITFGRADLMRAYAKLGWSDAQMQVLSSSPFFRSHVFLWWSLVSSVVFFGYLLWLKRHFRITTRQPEAQSVQAG